MGSEVARMAALCKSIHIPDFFQYVKLTGAPETNAADSRCSTFAVSCGNMIPKDMYACVNVSGGKSSS